MEQMRLQHDGRIIPETPDMIAEDENNAARKERLAKASDEVVELMGRDSDKGWIELFLIIHEVEEEKLYLSEYKSLTAWGTALAERGGFRLRELWRRKRAGEAYREYERQKEARGTQARPLEQIGDLEGMTPRNLETITKIAGGNVKVKEKLIDQLSKGKIGGAQLDSMWKAARMTGAKTRKTRHDSPEQDKDDLQKAVTAGRIVAAIQGASDGKWLPEEHKKRPWPKDKYRVFTEVAVFNGATDRSARIDVVLIETYGCEYMTDALIHAIEIKVSQSDLEGDVKMGDYADYADYMWLAVPLELKEAAEKHIDSLQGSQTWGLLLLDSDQDAEEDRLIVARSPKRIGISGGICRGKTFEYLVAKYI